MLNSVKLHENLWSISLASMFNWSSVPVRQNNSSNNTKNNSNNSVESSNGGGGGSGDGELDSTQRLNTDLGDQSCPNFDTNSLYHFPFPRNFLSRNLPEETCSSIKEKLMKQAGGKSFTIDSLLGITNAAQVAIQNCILPAHQCHIDGSSENSKWIQEKVPYDHHHGKESRFSPYHHSRKDRSQINLNSSNASQSEKSGEKSQKSSRRTTKSKRVRTIFTPEQLERLEAEFERQQYMVGPERLYLASSLYLTEAQVKVWFQNRRIKWRKQHLEMQQQRLAVFRSKHSSLENEEGDEYEEDSDGSTSATLPPSDSVPPSSSSNPLVTTFSGSLLQDNQNCINKDTLLENNVSSSTPYPSSRRPFSQSTSDSGSFLKQQQQ